MQHHAATDFWHEYLASRAKYAPAPTNVFPC
jgi:hypothetical protein